MGFLPPQIQDLVPWDNLQSFIDDWTKGLQVIADTINPENDNSNKVISPGTQFSTPVFWRVPVNALTHNYDDFYHAHGNAPYLVASHLSVSGSEVTLSGFTKLGKLYAGDWYNLNASDKEYVDGLFDSLNLSARKTVHNDGNHLILTSMIPGSNVLDLIPYDALPSYVYYQWENIDGAYNKANLGVEFGSYTLEMNEDQPEVYGDIKVVGYNYNAFPSIATKPLAPYSQPLVGMIENQDVINYYIENNDSTNNYHKTQDGYDIYYGDNYYIIKPNSQPVTYNKVYNVLVDTVPDIDPSLTIKTYDENKYPPTPAPGTWDSIESSGTYSGALQFVRSFYVDATTLLNLKNYMGKKEADGGPPDGYDMLESIIAIKMYPFALAEDATDSINISIPGSGSAWAKLMEYNWIARVAAAIDNTIIPENAPTQIRIVNTGQYGHATDAAMRNYSLGTINMSEFMNSTYPFLTYDSTVELYLPFVGTFTLDPQTVMGATLSAYLNLDPATGGVYAYCYANKSGNNVMIASGTGNIGVDIPISSAQAGVLQARVDAIRSQQAAGIVTTAAAIAAPIMGAAFAGGAAESAAIALGAGGRLSTEAFNMLSNHAHTQALRSAVGNSIPQISGEAVATMSSALTANRQVKQLTQSHNMAMTGSIGSSVAEWSCPHTAYVKVMRPKEHNPGTNYPHAVGVPTYTSGTLSSYKGLTVCINADTTSISKATAVERDAIASMLNGGVIV